ncbi:MAG: Glutaconyl-CoA decarboxylase subunit gamma [Pelotomaculum sp. PtaU1.Bin035]|nr:MAG: Glutaconyl-CoA decarboxylase subunit gamma [Pelotomaculum sp. PtaU1.Bin035]
MKRFKIKVNGEVYDVEVEESGGFSCASAPAAFPAPLPAPETVPVVPSQEPLPYDYAFFDAGIVSSPMPGIINNIYVKAGDIVKPGDVIAVLEAMKMENKIKADIAGTVKEVRVAKGQAVNGGDPLVIIG